MGDIGWGEGGGSVTVDAWLLGVTGLFPERSENEGGVEGDGVLEILGGCRGV